MMHSYYFRNNETDFFRWCREYVKRAQYYVHAFESNDSDWYRIYGRKEYMESVIIVRQYQILTASLSEELRAFLDDYLISNKPAPIYTPPYNSYTTIIFDHWSEICFPQNRSKIKTVDKYQLGKIIKAERIDAGMSRRQVAELLQINEKTLNAYENGERLVRVNVLYGMAQIYETSIDSIIEESMPIFLCKE